MIIVVNLRVSNFKYNIEMQSSGYEKQDIKVTYYYRQVFSSISNLFTPYTLLLNFYYY